MKNSDDSYNLYFINAFPSKNSWREMKVEKKKKEKAQSHDSFLENKYSVFCSDIFRIESKLCINIPYQ